MKIKNNELVGKEKELSFEQLDKVNGGSLRDLPKETTIDISESVKDRV